MRRKESRLVRAMQKEAATLIARAAAKTDRPAPRALDELKKVCAHNDQASWGQRVSASDAMRLLAAHGFACLSRSRLDRVSRLLGRRSYAQK
jgi:hypothetical protein